MKCLQCEKEISKKGISSSKYMKRKYCNLSCWARNTAKNRVFSAETRKKLSDAKKGLPPNNAGRKGEISARWTGGKAKCIDCNKQLGDYKPKNNNNSPRERCWDCYIKLPVQLQNNPMWKGGISKMKGYNAIQKRKRKIARLGNGGTHTIVEWNELKEKYNFMCLCCKQHEPYIKLTEDHIIPISKGGRNDIENIQPLCASCNSRKLTKTMDFRKELLSPIQYV